MKVPFQPNQIIVNNANNNSTYLIYKELPTILNDSNINNLENTLNLRESLSCQIDNKLNLANGNVLGLLNP